MATTAMYDRLIQQLSDMSMSCKLRESTKLKVEGISALVDGLVLDPVHAWRKRPIDGKLLF